jgi:hypothetical protein
MKTVTYDETKWMLVPVEMHTAQANAGWRALAAQGIEPEGVELDPVYKAMLAAAPQPPEVDEGVGYITMIEAFENYFQADAEDPSMEGELSIWEAAWKAAVGAQEEG